MFVFSASWIVVEMQLLVEFRTTRRAGLAIVSGFIPNHVCVQLSFKPISMSCWDTFLKSATVYTAWIWKIFVFHLTSCQGFIRRHCWSLPSAQNCHIALFVWYNQRNTWLIQRVLVCQLLLTSLLSFLVALFTGMFSQAEMSPLCTWTLTSALSALQMPNMRDGEKVKSEHLK